MGTYPEGFWFSLACEDPDLSSKKQFNAAWITKSYKSTIRYSEYQVSYFLFSLIKNGTKQKMTMPVFWNTENVLVTNLLVDNHLYYLLSDLYQNIRMKSVGQLV